MQDRSVTSHGVVLFMYTCVGFGLVWSGVVWFARTDESILTQVDESIG